MINFIKQNVFIVWLFSIQLRVREMETDLEAKTSSLNEALTTIETISEQNRLIFVFFICSNP